MVTGQMIRFSFLVRNAPLSREDFSRHYELVHGPLAAGLAGFRKYTTRYLQNHVDAELGDGRMAVDGVTQTFQRVRADYGTGFFQEPDYAAVQPDERYLFDVSRVRSVLGAVVHRREPDAGAGPVPKLMAVLETPDAGADRLVRQLDGAGFHEFAVTRLMPETASALGFDRATISDGLVVEAWVTRPERLEGLRVLLEQGWSIRDIWRMRELEVFRETTGHPSAR